MMPAPVLLRHPDTLRNGPKVAFATPGFGLGGAERWILSLARNFQGCRPYGLISFNGDVDPSMAREARSLFERVLIPVRDRDGKFSHRDADLNSVVDAADIVVSWGLPDLDQRLPRARVPLVHVSHADRNWPGSLELSRRAAEWANFLVGVSQSALSSFSFQEGSEPLASVIYNGADQDRVLPRLPIGRSACRQGWGFGDDKILLYLGRLDQSKGAQSLPALLNYLPPEYKLLLVGAGPLETSLRELASREYPDQIVFGYPKHYVGDLLAAADALLVPSRSEGFPLVVAEAWLAGLPVVCQRTLFSQEALREFGPVLREVPNFSNAPDTARSIQETCENSAALTEAAMTIAGYHTAVAMTARWEIFLAECLHLWHREPLCPSLATYKPLRGSSVSGGCDA